MKKYMRSKKISFRVPHDIFEMISERATALGYRNAGRYFVGVALGDIMQAGWLSRMKNIANADPDLQDFLVSQILKLPIEQEELARFLKGLLPTNGKSKNGKKK